jgi:tRNA dimethylallyltransferase
LDELQSSDPIAWNKIDKNNPQRIIRALEVCRVSGRPFSSFHERTSKDRPFDNLVFGLRRDRTELNERIASRFKVMMDAGWIEEAGKVQDKKHLNSLNTVGYKELFEYLAGVYSLEDCEELIVRETQRFAKRQMTWFKRTADIQWIELPSADVQRRIIQRAESLLHR